VESPPLALPFLITLRPPDQDPQPVANLRQIGDLEGAEFAAAERAGEAEREQCAVPLADHGVRAEREHLADQVRLAGAFPALAVPMVRRIPRSTALT
jgi:hypothetical protein